MHDFTVPKWLYPPYTQSPYCKWADELSSDFQSMVPCFSHPSAEDHSFFFIQAAPFIKNKCFTLFLDFLICALCGLTHSFLVNRFHWCLSAPSSVHGVHSCTSSYRLHGIWSEHEKCGCILTPTLLHVTVLCSKCSTDCLESPLSIISTIVGKLQSTFDLLLIFFLLPTLVWNETQKSSN